MCLSMRFQTSDKVVSWIKAIFQHADVAARSIAHAAYDVAELVLADEEDIKVCGRRHGNRSMCLGQCYLQKE